MRRVDVVCARARAVVERSLRGAVAGRHRPPAAAAADDPLAQRAALARRARAAAGVVGGQALLVGQERLPADVAGVVVLDHDRPLRAWQLDRLGRDRAVRCDGAARAKAPEHVDARVGRVGQHADRARVRQAPPAQLARPRAAIGALREPPLGERADHAIGRAGLRERVEHVGDRGRDLLVGVDDRRAVLVIEVADGQREAQRATLGRRALGALQPAGEDVELCLGHRALQPDQQTVVEAAQIVDPVGVDDQRVSQPAQLKQPLEVRAGAR